MNLDTTLDRLLLILLASGLIVPPVSAQEFPT